MSRGQSGSVVGQMRVRRLHDWELSPKQARELQQRLAGRLVRSGRLRSCELVAGCDVAQDRAQRRCWAAVVLMRFKPGAAPEVVERVGAERPTTFPYVPGLLSFREAPVLFDAFAKLRGQPDLVLVDAAGYAHPRRFGLACHVGLALELPTVGCAKSRLCGQYAEPPVEAGTWSPLYYEGELVGAVVRSRTAVKPLFVSVGHLVALDDAVRTVLDCCRGYRLPEPLRVAHRYACKLRGASAFR